MDILYTIRKEVKNMFKEFAMKNPVLAKVVMSVAAIAVSIKSASAALDTNVTDGITFASQLGTIAIGYFLAPPLVYFVVVIAALIVLLVLGRLFRRFM